MPESSQIDNHIAFARCLKCKKIDTFAPLHWLALGCKDLVRAPLLSILYGVLFSLIPAAILFLIYKSGTHLVILPASVAFALVGPVFAVGLYDIAWELEKGHQPKLMHSLKSMFRNPVGEWGFAIMLMIIMVVWMRLAALVHALYPPYANPTLEELSAFLTLGSFIGAIMLIGVFSISAFTPQIMMERRVDVISAAISSINAVKENASASLVWAICLLLLVGIGFATFAIGFIVIMPLLSFASWHGYIAVIEHKAERGYE